MNKLEVEKPLAILFLYMRKLFYLLIIGTLGFSVNFISHPKLFQYPNSISKIDSISKGIDKRVKNINFGGCGYFAYYMTDLLDSIGLDYKISIINVEPVKNHITHVLVYLPEYCLFVDSKGVYKAINVNNDQYFYCLKVERLLSKSELRFTLSNQKWNKKFNLKDTTLLKSGLRF